MTRFWILFFLFFSITRCSEFCQLEVEDITYLANNTSRSLSLEVCLNEELGTRTLTISADQNGRFSLGSREIEYPNNDISSECNREDGEEQLHTVTLTSSHFSEVKFCHPSLETESIVIIEPSENCPEGTTEQAVPSTTCLPNETVSF